MKKKIAAWLLALTIAVSPATVAAEWVQGSDQKWQWTENGMNVTGWKFIVQKWYYFDAHGDMLTGWQMIDGKQYYFKENGAMAIGWNKVDGNWYYMNSSGEMVTGWKKVLGYWYYMNPKGVMQTGWLNYGHDKYYLDKNGAMEIGWVQVGEDWYFMNHDGILQTGVIEVNGSVYYLDLTGKMLTGKVKIGNTQYVFSDTGEATGKTRPQPGKAFDAFGNTAAITVDTDGSGSSGSSGQGGSTIIYVPTDSPSGGGNSGGSGLYPDPNPDPNPGDAVSDAEKLSALDDYLASKVPQINEEHGRDFDVSFDKVSHVINVSIKNTEKRIANIYYGDLFWDLCDYQDGLVTKYTASYENSSFTGTMYEIHTNAQGSKYRYPVYLGRYTTEFIEMGIPVLSRLKDVAGKTMQVTLHLGDLDTRPYTVNFSLSETTVEDIPDCGIEIYNSSSYNYDYYPCVETEDGFYIDYKLPDGYEYVINWNDQYLAAGASDYFYYLYGASPMEIDIPDEFHCKKIEGSKYQITIDKAKDYRGRPVARYQPLIYTVTFGDDRIEVSGLDLSNFRYYVRSNVDTHQWEKSVIGTIWIEQKVTEHHLNYDGVSQSADKIKISADGLEIPLDMAEKNLYNADIEFSRPITVKGSSFNRLYLSYLQFNNLQNCELSADLWYRGGPNINYIADKSAAENGCSFTLYPHFTSSQSFTLTARLSSDGKSVIIPEITENVLSSSGEKAYINMQIEKTPPVSCRINGGETEKYAIDENGFTVSVDGYGAFQEEFRISSVLGLPINGKTLKSMYIYFDENHELHGDVSVQDADGRYLNLNRFTVLDGADSVRIFRFQSMTETFDLRVKFSENKKTITFLDLTDTVLENGYMDIWLSVQ